MTRLIKPLFGALLALAAFSFAASAYDKNELAEFNDLYKNGSYRQALDGYLKMAAAENDNPWAFYNAGNAYFRLNEHGPAVLYYARAFSLRPGSADIRANLDYALRQTGQSLVPPGVPKSLHYFYYLLSVTDLKGMCVVFFWLACFAGALRALSSGALKERLKAAPFALAAVCLLFLMWAGLRAGTSPFSGGAVATVPASLLSGPGEKFKTYATLPEGRLVSILDETDDVFYEVGLGAEGIQGWVKKTDMQKI